MASSSDDATIAIWRIEDDYKIIFDDPEEIKDIAPIRKLKGHTRKVGHVLFHPVASNILASSSHDYTVKFWNIETGENLYTLPHKDLVTSFSFNHDGSLLATVSRDKTLRIWDIRAEKILQEAPGHTGAKASRVAWLGSMDRLVTTGFSKLSDRQYALWDTNDITKGPINGFVYLDGSSGSCIPYFDESTNCLYLAGKGDGNVRYFEFENDDLFPLSEYMSSDPQRGMAFLPKRAVNTHDHEVVRFFKSVNDTTIEPISFIVPRRADTFQDDIYPEAYAGEPSLTAEEWVSGKNSPPKVINMEDVFNGQAPTSTIAQPKPTPTPVSAKKEEAPAKKSEPVKKVVEPVEPEKPAKLDDVLATSDSVSSLLDKAKKAEDSAIPKSLEKEESSWDADPVPTKRPSPSPEPVQIKKTESEPVKAETPKKVDIKRDEPKKAEIKKDISSASPRASTSTANAVTKSNSNSNSSSNSSSDTSSVVQNEQLQSLSKTLDVLEAKVLSIDTIAKNVSSLESKLSSVDSLSSRFDLLEAKVDEVNETSKKVNELKSQLNTVLEAIQKLEENQAKVLELLNK